MARQLVDRTTADLAAAKARIDTLGGDALLSTRQVAAMLGRPVATVRDWRSRKVGPRYILGGECTYRWADVQAWLDSRTVDPGVNGGAA